jgi:hypothetical protein
MAKYECTHVKDIVRGDETIRIVSVGVVGQPYKVGVWLFGQKAQCQSCRRAGSCQHAAAAKRWAKKLAGRELPT